jgi:hypothetical protein
VDWSVVMPRRPWDEASVSPTAAQVFNVAEQR